MCDLSKVRFTGPLAQFHAGFAAELTELGYTPFSARAQLELAAHLSRWMAQTGADVADLDPVLVQAFLQARVAAGYRAFRSAKALAPLLEHLRGLGLVAPVARACPSTATEVLLERFGVYLETERALVAGVVRGYTDLVRPFIETAVRHGGLAVLTAADVTSFMVASADRLAPKTVQRLASALRSLLRFWLVDGEMTMSLIEAVPKVAHHPAHLPRGLEPAKVAAMLASCDTTANGQRDRAILLILSRLGLRAGEAAGLELEDVDWRAGLVTVRGKGNRTDTLPLPPDVGLALADYLRAGRPTDVTGRSVFVRVLAPHRRMTSGGITQAVAAAGVRAGLAETVYAHRLRHSAATAMLAAGSPMAEIGQVLRHRRPLTTAGYARVDVEALRALARPWPGSS